MNITKQSKKKKRLNILLTNEERDTRSLGDSRVSGCRLSESHESEVGVSGRALCDL